jgi:hypothetical protein
MSTITACIFRILNFILALLLGENNTKMKPHVNLYGRLVQFFLESPVSILDVVEGITQPTTMQCLARRTLGEDS